MIEQELSLEGLRFSLPYNTTEAFLRIGDPVLLLKLTKNGILATNANLVDLLLLGFAPQEVAETLEFPIELDAPEDPSSLEGDCIDIAFKTSDAYDFFKKAMRDAEIIEFAVEKEGFLKISDAERPDRYIIVALRSVEDLRPSKFSQTRIEPFLLPRSIYERFPWFVFEVVSADFSPWLPNKNANLILGVDFKGQISLGADYNITQESILRNDVVAHTVTTGELKQLGESAGFPPIAYSEFIRAPYVEGALKTIVAPEFNFIGVVYEEKETINNIRFWANSEIVNGATLPPTQITAMLPPSNPSSLAE